MKQRTKDFLKGAESGLWLVSGAAIGALALGGVMHSPLGEHMAVAVIGLGVVSVGAKKAVENETVPKNYGTMASVIGSMAVLAAVGICGSYISAKEASQLSVVACGAGALIGATKAKHKVQDWIVAKLSQRVNG